MTRLSVTVPAYQVAEYLPRCLDSLLSQTVRDIEIIVVNDGSTDSTGLICDYFSSTDRRVRVIHQVNKGLVSARKVAAARASAPFIACVDGDDYVDDDFFERLLDLADSSRADVVVGGHVRDYGEIQQLIPPSLTPGVYRDEAMSEILSCFISRAPFFSHGISTYLWGKLFRTQLYREAQHAVPDDFTIGEDAACVYPMIMCSKTIAVSGFSGYHYVQRQSSMLKTRADRVPIEVARMSNLIDFIRSRLVNDKDANLERQLDEYELSQIIIRGGGVFDTMEQTFVVCGRRLKRGVRVAIYSAGTFGQVMFHRIKSSKLAEVSAWVDDDWIQYRKDGLPVSSDLSLLTASFDAVIIASLSPAFVSLAKSRLADLGVADSKILHYPSPKDASAEVIKMRRLAASSGLSSANRNWHLTSS